jgi:hypothetical protein
MARYSIKKRRNIRKYKKVQKVEVKGEEVLGVVQQENRKYLENQGEII